MYGYAGEILRIDLSKSQSSKEELTIGLAKKYLGGNGFGVRILFDEVGKRVDPFDSNNKLILATGPVTGTLFPGSGKMGFFSKSPLTGIFGESYAGGDFGREMKYAGYDVVIMDGKSDKPTYLWICDENVEFRDGREVWSKHVSETREMIKKEVGRDAVIASIGRAGEKLVKLACIDVDGHQAGRTGLGAVMGSKNLKAIAVRGTGEIRIAKPRRFFEEVAKVHEKGRTFPTASGYVNWGTAGWFKQCSDGGWVPTRNFQTGTFEHADKLDSHYWIPLYQVKTRSCASCVMPCSQLIKIEKGAYAGTSIEGPEYETIFALGSDTGVGNFEAVARASELCDEYGLDTISTGAAIAWGMECYERGILTKADTEGIELKFGNSEALIECVEKIAYREGIGAILAEGVKRASEKIGKGSDAFAMHVKGLEMSGYEGRAMKGMALSFAVSNRGACHLRSCEYAAEEFGVPFTPLGFKDTVDSLTYEKKGEVVARFEDLHTLYDCLVVCKFQRFWLGTPEDIAVLTSLVTGQKMSGNELIKIGEKVTNLERAFNVREGISRKDDTIPKRWIEEPLTEPNRVKDQRVSLDDFNKMLEEYYTIRGWNKNGIPTEEKLKELNLEDVAKVIGL